MANVSHASLTGSQLHEPKGADTATLGTVYVANGAGSGSWNSIGTSSFTGMISDFVAVEPPTGWLELDGSVVSTSTYSALYGVLAKQSSGTRTNGSAVITSIPDTTAFRVGYNIFGTGITAGSTIQSIDSATQVTISIAASSSGTSTFAVSPCVLGAGTIKLPDVSTSGRYRRSRTSTLKVGDVLADQNQAHAHTMTSTGSTSVDPGHFHGAGIYDTGHAHSVNVPGTLIGPGVLVAGGGSFFQPNTSNLTTSNNATGIRLTSGNGLDTTDTRGVHAHSVTVSGTSSSNGGTETRPVSLVVMTCIKT